MTIHLMQEIGIKYIFRGKISSYRKEIEKMETEDEEIEIKITEKKVKSVEEKEVKEKLRKKGKIETRLVKYQLETGEEEILITNLEEKEFAREEVGKLYFRRWNIELAYNIAKNKLELQNFSGQNKIVVEQEFYGQMLMLNIAEDFRKDANKGIEKKKGYCKKLHEK